MAIENTSNRDPLLNLIGLMGGSETYITEMEAAGARQVANSDKLPAKGDWEAAEALGIIKGEPVPGDDLFVTVTLPEGWSRKLTDHDMYTNIVDERGIPRVQVGYKAAFYDRWAQFGIVDLSWAVIGFMRYSDEGQAGEVVLPLPDYWEKMTVEEKFAALDRAKDNARHEQELADGYDNEEYWQKHADLAANVAKSLASTILLETEA
jgi:hypothetical protein